MVNGKGIIRLCTGIALLNGSISRGKAETSSLSSNMMNACKATEISFINDDHVLNEVRFFRESYSMDSLDDEDTALAISDFDTALNEQKEASKGTKAFEFLIGLANSESFRKKFWHKAPLLIRAEHSGGWITGSYTIERDLKSIAGSYITGHKTGEALRNGTSTDTWLFEGLKQDLNKKTTWPEVETAMKDGTIYFNTAGSMWPITGALCRIFMQCFGLPTNVNIYITPNGVPISVPPHTDRQDVIVLQTAGSKRWRVYAPPKRKKGVDALNRGKGGDVLQYSEMGPPLIDTTLEAGDMLYVPTGFPHTTDTSTITKDTDHDQTKVFSEPSVHLTMGLDTHVWALTYAHLRWCLLQRCGKDFNLSIEKDSVYWASMETPPIGFLGGKMGYINLVRARKGASLDLNYVSGIRNDLKRIMLELEPDRWGSNDDSFPTDDEFNDVINYMFHGLIVPLIENQFEMFSNVDPQSDESMVKAFQCSQRQSKIMEKFSAFAGNEQARQSFASRQTAAFDETAQASKS